MRITPCHATSPHMCYDIMWTSCGACMQASQPPLLICGMQEINYLLFMPAEQHLLKLTISHFNTLNMKIANQNMLKRILIAMQDEHKANCNENFRICSEESIGPLYKW